jgi:hypothetical protein
MLQNMHRRRPALGVLGFSAFFMTIASLAELGCGPWQTRSSAELPLAADKAVEKTPGTDPLFETSPGSGTVASDSESAPGSASFASEASVVDREELDSAVSSSFSEPIESLFRVRNPRPYEPDDPRELHWLGDGYDLLSGGRKGSCLNLDAITLRSYPINQAFDTMDLVFSKSEMAKKLSTNVNAEISGTYQGVSFSPSLKATILRETNITGNVLVAVASFIYAKDQISIYESVPGVDPSRSALLSANKEEFRRQCGDKFSKSIRTGAALFLIVRAEQLTETSHSQSEIQQAFKVGLGQLFGISPSLTVTNDQKNILSRFRLSTRCYSDGVSGRPCADHQLNLSSFTVGDMPIFEKVSAAKKALVSEAMERKVTAVLDEQMDYYPFPREDQRRGVFDVFFDYRPYLSKIRLWLALEDRVQSICQSLYRDVWADECRSAADGISEALTACADQDEWSQGLCRAPESEEFADLLALDNGGWVELWDYPGAQGRSVKLSFAGLLRRGAGIRPNVIYSLHDDRFDFADQLSSVVVHLEKGWQLVLYEHVDGMGSKWVIQPGPEQTINFPRWFGNKASSFVVKRVD